MYPGTTYCLMVEFYKSRIILNVVFCDCFFQCYSLFLFLFGRGPEREPPECISAIGFCCPHPAQHYILGLSPLCLQPWQFLFLCNIPLYKNTTLCSFYCEWTLGTFPVYHYYKKCSNSCCSSVSLCTHPRVSVDAQSMSTSEHEHFNWSKQHLPVSRTPNHFLLPSTVGKSSCHT